MQASTVTEQMGCFKKRAVSHWASESPNCKHLIAIDSSGQLSLCNNDRISKNYWVFYVQITTVPNWSMVSLKSFFSITKANIRDHRDQCFDQCVVNFARGEKGNQDSCEALKVLLQFKGKEILLLLSHCCSGWVILCLFLHHIIYIVAKLLWCFFERELLTWYYVLWLIFFFLLVRRILYLQCKLCSLIVNSAILSRQTLY